MNVYQNCSWFWDYKLNVIALSTIKKDDEINVTYVGMLSKTIVCFEN